jgi:S-(hydroxymethyl)glutathione dehydrogenase/alcohol dehydrogenase
MKSRAALFSAVDAPLAVAEVELEAPREDDVLVRMVAAGVCGSDLHVVRGEWSRPTPMVLGHEGAGVVDAVGDAVTSVSVGDRVIISWAPACQVCGSCRRGRPAACSELRAAIGNGTLIDGTTRLSRGGERVYRMTTVGAFADLVLVPERAAIRIPNDVSLDEAALLGCAALTGVGAVENVAHAEPGTRAVVIGAGAVGQFAIQGLTIAGAEEIVAVDPSADRREQAVALGATNAVTPEQLPEVVGSREEGFDHAFDAVGGARTARAALSAVRNGGVAVLVGMGAPGDTLEVDPLQFVTTEKTLVGSIYGSGDPPKMTERLLGYVADGTLELAGMIGPKFGLDEINQAVEVALKGRGGRTLIELDGVAA